MWDICHSVISSYEKYDRKLRVSSFRVYQIWNILKIGHVDDAQSFSSISDILSRRDSRPAILKLLFLMMHFIKSVLLKLFILSSFTNVVLKNVLVWWMCKTVHVCQFDCIFLEGISIIIFNQNIFLDEICYESSTQKNMRQILFWTIPVQCNPCYSGSSSKFYYFFSGVVHHTINWYMKRNEIKCRSH